MEKSELKIKKSIGVEKSIDYIQRIVNSYQLNDPNNYDYSDELLRSLRALLNYIKTLEKTIDK